MPHLGPLPDAPRCVKIRLIGQNNGITWVNIFHTQWQTGGTVPTPLGLANMATTLRTAWTTNFAPQFVTSSSLSSVECTDISSRTGNQGVDSTNVNGTNATAPAPLNAAACISWIITRRYRGGHPRTYLSGVDGSSYTIGRTWNAAKQTAYGNAAAAWRTAINALTTDGNTWTMVNVSYFRTVGGVQAYKVPPDVDLITGYKFHTRLDTQRRRLGKETS